MHLPTSRREEDHHERSEHPAGAQVTKLALLTTDSLGVLGCTQIGARLHGTPVPLNVPKHCLRAPIVSAGIPVKRIREVATEDRPHAKIDQLADPIRSAEHTDVRMNAHKYHVRNLVQLQEIPHLLPVVTHRVRRRYVNRRNLTRPGMRWLAIVAGIRRVTGTGAWISERAR